MRSDVVIVDFRPTNPDAKVRPAVVVQSDRLNTRMANTVVAQITTNLARSHEETQLLIAPDHPDWMASGLRLPSVINAANLATVRQIHITQVIGRLSQDTMVELDDCLWAALDL